jgi:hypothetical protein
MHLFALSSSPFGHFFGHFGLQVGACSLQDLRCERIGRKPIHYLPCIEPLAVNVGGIRDARIDVPHDPVPDGTRSSDPFEFSPQRHAKRMKASDPLFGIVVADSGRS